MSFSVLPSLSFCYDGKVVQECGAPPSWGPMVRVVFSNAVLSPCCQLSDFTTLSSWGFQVGLCTELENNHYRSNGWLSRQKKWVRRVWCGIQCHGCVCRWCNREPQPYQVVQFYFLFLFMWVRGSDVTCAATVCFAMWPFACLLVVSPCLEEPSAATAEGWGKQTDGDRSSERQYVMYQQLCVLPRESAAGDEFMRWQLPMKSPLAKSVMEKV